jgi:hypothetical protein
VVAAAALEAGRVGGRVGIAGADGHAGATQADSDRLATSGALRQPPFGGDDQFRRRRDAHDHAVEWADERQEAAEQRQSVTGRTARAEAKRLSEDVYKRVVLLGHATTMAHPLRSHPIALTLVGFVDVDAIWKRSLRPGAARQ